MDKILNLHRNFAVLFTFQTTVQAQKVFGIDYKLNVEKHLQGL